MKVAVLVFTKRGFDAGCKDKGVKAGTLMGEYIGEDEGDLLSL